MQLTQVLSGQHGSFPRRQEQSLVLTGTPEKQRVLVPASSQLFNRACAGVQAEETLLERHSPSEFLRRLTQISVSSRRQGRAEVQSGLFQGRFSAAGERGCNLRNKVAF